jgi:hypothetical protein
LKRPETPKDNWKFSTGDLKERERWEDYLKYYDEQLTRLLKIMLLSMLFLLMIKVLHVILLQKPFGKKCKN